MSRPTTASSDVLAVSAALEALTTTAFEVCERIAHGVRSLLDDGAPMTRGRLKPVGDLAVAEIESRPGSLQGAGFVAAVDRLADAGRWLEWYSTDAAQRPQRLVVQSDPRNEYFYDYTVLPWYVVPAQTRHRHITGPYVDYLCTNDYSLTFTVPVLNGSDFVGVAGCDVGVATAEAALMPSLRAAAQRLAVVNADGRVIASNSGRHICGDLVDRPDVAARWEAAGPWLHRLDDLPVAVVELGERAG